MCFFYLYKMIILDMLSIAIMQHFTILISQIKLLISSYFNY